MDVIGYLLVAGLLFAFPVFLVAYFLYEAARSRLSHDRTRSVMTDAPAEPVPPSEVPDFNPVTRVTTSDVEEEDRKKAA